MKQKVDLLGYEVTIRNQRELKFYNVTKQRCLDIVQYKDDPYFREGDNALSDEDVERMLERMASDISGYIQGMYFLDMISEDMPHLFYVDEIINYYSTH